MMWSLPLSVEIDGRDYKIRNKCDYRMVLDVINALNDEELEKVYRIQCALQIFYEDLAGLTNYEKAIDEMLKIINNGEENKGSDNSPQLMDWEYDFKLIAPPISKVLGYSVRDPEKHTHWYDFVGAYMEIDESVWSTVIAIRIKKQKGKKLEKWEEEFCREHPDWISLPQKFTQEEEEFFSLFEQKGEI
jgi:hypothetical protein